MVPGQAGIYWNGALRLTWPEPNLTGTVTVRASGMLAGDIGPMMTLRVDGVVVGSTEVRSTEPADHVFAIPPLAAGSKVDVAFTNHAVVDGQARNLNVHYLRTGNTVLLPTASGVTIDLGNGLAAFDGIGMQPGRASINVNGALRGKWPAANMTDTITVRASATLAGNVGAMMDLQVDGVVLGSAEVRSTTPTDFSFPSLPIQPGSQIALVHTNPGSVAGQTRSLAVAYLLAGTTVLRPADAGMVATATSLRGAWPAPNLTDTLTVRARGTLAGGVPPTMQVRVDGVLLGSTDVRNTGFADFSFPSLPMQPGRKVDVVFTNDAVINGEDRNLFIDYLVSGSTFMRPNAAGTVIDRGIGAAAFDGLDVITGHGNLAWNGAWRATWPQPNITDRLTVRASGTLAGNVGPILQLRVDGVAVSSVEVRAPTPGRLQLAHATVESGQQDRPGLHQRRGG